MSDFHSFYLWGLISHRSSFQLLHFLPPFTSPFSAFSSSFKKNDLCFDSGEMCVDCAQSLSRTRTSCSFSRDLLRPTSIMICWPLWLALFERLMWWLTCMNYTWQSFLCVCWFLHAYCHGNCFNTWTEDNVGGTDLLSFNSTIINNSFSVQQFLIVKCCKWRCTSCKNNLIEIYCAIILSFLVLCVTRGGGREPFSNFLGLLVQKTLFVFKTLSPPNGSAVVCLTSVSIKSEQSFLCLFSEMLSACIQYS